MVLYSTTRPCGSGCLPVPSAVTPARVPRLTPTSPTIRSTTHQGRRGAMEKSELYSAHSRLRKFSFGTAKTLHFLFAVSRTHRLVLLPPLTFQASHLRISPSQIDTRFLPKMRFLVPAALLTPPPHSTTEQNARVTRLLHSSPATFCPSVCLSVGSRRERERERVLNTLPKTREGTGEQGGRPDCFSSLLMEVELFCGEY